MYKFFKNFDFLVTPIAYSFKAFIKSNYDLKLLEAYGVPKFPDDDATKEQEMISVQTLFFAGEGGGTILLEYELKPQQNK